MVNQAPTYILLHVLQTCFCSSDWLVVFNWLRRFVCPLSRFLPDVLRHLPQTSPIPWSFNALIQSSPLFTYFPSNRCFKDGKWERKAMAVSSAVPFGPIWNSSTEWEPCICACFGVSVLLHSCYLSLQKASFRLLDGCCILQLIAKMTVMSSLCVHNIAA